MLESVASQNSCRQHIAMSEKCKGNTNPGHNNYSSLLIMITNTRK